MNRQQQKKQFPLKPLILTVAILIIFGLAYGVSAKQLSLWPFNDTTSDSSPDYVSPEEVEKNNDAKQNFIENNDNTYNGEPSGDSNDVTMKTEQSDDTLTVLTQLHGYSDGKCTLKITNGSNTTSKTADVIYQQEYSTCAGFSINKYELPAGDWALELTVESKGVTVTKQATVDVR